MHLSPDERKEKILYALDNFGKVSVRHLSSELSVTPETIRRDLDDLEKQHKLKRVHGGAVKISYDKIEPAYMTRKNVYKDEKKRIGKKAAEIINDGDSIAIDVGTTCGEILHYLVEKKNLTVVLNSVFALNVLIDYKMRGLFDGKIIFLGGEINADHMSTYGPISENLLDNFYLDKVFLAIGGIDLQGGLTSYNISEANLSHHLATNAKEVVVLTDHSKVGVRNFYKISSFETVDMIICDKPCPTEWADKIESEEIAWIQA